MDTKGKGSFFKRKRIILIAIILCLSGIQLFRPEKNNQKVFMFNDFLVAEKAPKKVAELFRNSCYNCHSNNTTYYWYDEIAPFSWFVANHITEAKNQLNFSEWTASHFMDKRSNLSKIASTISEEKMPLPSYTLIHRDAKLSENEKQEILKWLFTIEVKPN